MSTTHVSLGSSRKPRVLQCITHLALGGAERVALALTESLATDYDFAVYAVRGLADGEVGEALRQRLLARDTPLVTGLRIPMRFGGMVTGGLGLARAIRRFEPDLIHLHTEIPEASYAAMVALFPGLRRLPLVRTVHNAVIWNFSPWLGRVCDRQMPQAYVAGVSNDAVAAFLSLRSSSGAARPPQPPVTIYNGVPPAGPAGMPRPADGTIRMVYGGRLEPEKGTDLLPEIIARTQLPDGIRAHLTIYGSGRHERVLRSLARNPPPGWEVAVHPPISNFAAHLNTFDLVLLPSRYEGLCLVAVEALLAGIQIVATNAPGLREALPPHHPWSAELGDARSFAKALDLACSQRARWTALAETGRAFALDRFAPGKMAVAYRTLYQQALADRKENAT